MKQEVTYEVFQIETVCEYQVTGMQKIRSII